MKRAANLIPLIADPDNLLLAFWKASKGKRHAPAILAYQKRLDVHLVKLREQILSGNVSVGQYRFFRIFEPKERRICAAAFGEQVLHHAFMNICHDYFERRQFYDSYASRKDKGVHAALRRARAFTGGFAWYLKLDVRKFFESVHHEVLKAQLARLFNDTRLLDIFGRIIDAYEAHPLRGLPIGNLTSQYFANHYLTVLDETVKARLRLRAYVRYMDDLVLWHDDKAVLKNACSMLLDQTRDSLRCELKPPILNKTASGLPFLGYHIFPHHVRLTQTSKTRFARKLRYLHQKYHSGEWSEARCARHALPLIAFTHYADARAFRAQVLDSLDY